MGYTVYIILHLALIARLMSQAEAGNVALNKPASQGHYWDRISYPVSLANNGWKGALQENNSLAEMAHTQDKIGRWWTVDLEGDYYIRDVIIYNRLDCCLGRLNKLFILTSSVATPENPDLNSSDWTIRSYKHSAVGYYERKTLYTNDTVRHVAILKISPYGLALREVEIFNYSNPEDAPVNQINTSTVQLSSNAQKNGGSTDGLINMFDGLYETVNGETTWTAQLKEPCDRCYVKIYPHLNRSKSPQDDFSKLSEFTVRAHNQAGITPPVGGWIVTTMICGTYNNDQNGPLIVLCNLDGINFIRIRNDKQSEVIELTEVQVFPREPANIQITDIQPNSYECVTISWNNLASIALCDSIRWKCTGIDWSSETLTSSTVQSCGHEALSTVTCQVIAIGIGGVSKESEPISTNTSDCTAPSQPTYTVTEGLNADQTWGTVTTTDIQVNDINCNRLKTLVIHVTSPGKSNSLQVRSSNFYADEVIGNLDEGINYTIRVTAINNRDKSSFTETSAAITFALKPGPVSSLSVFGSSTDCITVTWRSPSRPNDVITGYKIMCGNRQESTKSATDRFHQECNYLLNQQVTCTVKAVSGVGDGVPNSRTGTTFCGRPSTPTFNLTDAGMQADSAGKLRRKIRVFNIQVDKINCASLTLTKIKVYDGFTLVYTHEFPNQNDIEILDIDAVTEYRVIVSVVNNGSGESEPREMRIYTGELAPETAPVLVGLDLNSSCGILEWRQPVQPNGIILYSKVTCQNLNLTINRNSSSDQDQISFCGLASGTRVTCSISAKNSIGWSPEASREDYTEVNLIQQPGPPRVSQVADRIEVEIDYLQFTDEDTRVEYYQFVIEMVEPGAKQQRAIPGSLVNTAMLYNWSTADSMDLTYYVAARLYNQSGDIIRFTCGDNQIYGGYYNKPLENDIDYLIHYTYTIRLEEEYVTYLELSSEAWQIPKIGQFQLIYLSFISLILVIPAAVVLCILIRRKSSASEDKRETQLNTINLKEAQAADGLELDVNTKCNEVRHIYDNVPADYIGPESNIYTEPTNSETDPHSYTKIIGVGNKFSSGHSPDNDVESSIYSPYYEDISENAHQTISPKMRAQQALPVPLPGKREHATGVQKIMDDKLIEYRSNPTRSVIYMEFQAIQKELRNLQADYSNGRKRCNIVKNACPDILPDQFFRVFLAGGSNDYINAINIEGFKKRNGFVVTQNPLPTTVTDFWLMVHEQKIVNLIQLEDTKMTYIPANDGESLKFGDFTICRVNTWNEANVDIIKLEMSPPHITNRKQKVEEITLFRYLDWNEKNMVGKQSLVDFYLTVKRDLRQKYHSPVLIMCGNGATKCGVYVNMHSILEKLELEQIADVYKSVLQTRSRRPQFISDVESYAGLYEIVRTFASCFSEYSNFK